MTKLPEVFNSYSASVARYELEYELTSQVPLRTLLFQDTHEYFKVLYDCIGRAKEDTLKHYGINFELK